MWANTRFRKKTYGRTSAGRWVDTETGTVDVAPVTPFLTETLDTVAAGIDDSLAWHTGSLESSAEELDVSLLIVGLVPLSICGVLELSWGLGPGVPSGDVGSNTTDLGWRTSGLVDLGNTLSSWLDVVVPSEPSSVTGINVHDDVGQVELLEGISNTLFVTLLGVLARLEVNVSDQVRKRIWLNDEGESSVWKSLEHLLDLCSSG